MTRLYLVRHGHTVWDDVPRLKGQLEVGLSPLGRAQAAEVGCCFRKGAIAAVYCGTLCRARQTAQPVAVALGQPVLVSPLLDERNWGLLQGLTAEQSRFSRTEGQNVPSTDPPLGERLEAFAERVQVFLDLVAYGRAGEEVIAVTHEGVIKTAILPAMGLTVADRSAFRAAPGTISLIEHHGQQWRPVFLNCTPAQATRHLRGMPPAEEEEGVGEAVCR